MSQEKIRELLVGKGWVMAEDIIDQSGINKQTFFYHLRKMINRDEVLIALANDVISNKKIPNRYSLAYLLIQ